MLTSTAIESLLRLDSWGKLLSTSGSLASTLGKNNPFRYRGYVYDEETGFYYLQSRYYNPEVGRFISSDVLLSTGQGVLGHNAYAYCLNNPVNMDDHDGNWPKWIEDTANWVKDNIVQPIRKVFCALKQSNVPKASSHDANRRPNTGEPGSTYTAPNGDSRTYGAMVNRNMITTIMTTEGRINIPTIQRGDIITIGKMESGVRHTPSVGEPLQGRH